MYIPATDNVVKGYEIDNSLRFNDNDNAYLSRTPASAGNRKTWTWAGWVKRGNIGITQNIFGCGLISGTYHYHRIFFDAGGQLRVMYYPDTASSVLYSDQLFRDVGAWYHLAVAWDTTQTTASDRVKIYVNGEQMTSFASSPWGAALYPAQNTDGHINNTTYEHRIGRFVTGGSNEYLDGYLSDVHFIDGQALTPDSFGETGDYGEFKPIAYTGTYGANGFHLDFKDAGALGNDVSGNNNDWTPTNLAATDQMIDTPTNNFAVLNVLRKSGGATTSQGNLRVNSASTNSDSIYSSIYLPEAGKWYCEMMVEWYSAYTTPFLGVESNHNYRANGQIYIDGALATTTTGHSAGDVIGMAVDVNAKVIKWYLNGVLKYTSATVSADLYNKAVQFYRARGASSYPPGDTQIANFGQDSSFAGNKTAQGNTDANGIGDFYYSPPAGFLALCTKNLDEPTVIPSEHFNTVLWTGSGAAQSITGVGFQPDFTWVKDRGDTTWHELYDAVRGASKYMYSNGTNAELTDSTHLNSFDSDGFTVGAGDFSSGKTMVSWCWKANGAGVSNTDGSITSTVSANVDAGFSIVGWTGNGATATVGHGLTQPPEAIIVKHRNTTSDWDSYFAVLGNGQKLELNNTFAQQSTTLMNNTDPTASVFSTGAFGSGNNLIAYAFHSVDGYSKFGSYTGNGSTDGPFVYCSFKPKYVMVKRTDSTGHWPVADSEREGYNVDNDPLYANLSNVEGTDDWVDLLSSGFKLRSSTGDWNANGGTYLFIAFAEYPFSKSNGA